MTPSPISRRALLQGGGAALAGVSVLRIAGPTYAFQTPVAGEVIPWLDQLEPNPVPEVIVQQLNWSQLDADTWITLFGFSSLLPHGRFRNPRADPEDH